MREQARDLGYFCSVTRASEPSGFNSNSTCNPAVSHAPVYKIHLSRAFPNTYNLHVMSSASPPSRPLKPSHGLELATPSLTLDFTISVKLHPKISVGPTPWGQRNWISFVGGEWEATWGSGTVIVCEHHAGKTKNMLRSAHTISSREVCDIHYACRIHCE